MKDLKNLIRGEYIMNRIFTALLVIMSMTGFAFCQTQAGPASGGQYVAAAYNYGGNGPQAPGPLKVAPGGGTNVSGAGTLILTLGAISPQNGRRVSVLSPNAPITVDGGANLETVTPTAVSCSTPDIPNTCSVTATFSFAHGAGAVVTSGTAGLQEAIDDAANNGGGLVVVDQLWAKNGGTSALIAAATPYQNVSIEDRRTVNSEQYYNMQATAATFLASPATLTAVTALPSATPVGAYGTGTYHLAIAYVDASGQVGPESADFSEAGLATGSFIFSAPAASPGAVGYVIYISLTSGTYSLDYQVPLTTQCTLTTLETVTPACAVANTTYNQLGSAATITAITVNTSPVGMILGGVSGTLLTGNPNGRTTYGYVASNHLASGGIPTVALAFTAGGIGSATPIAIGTVNISAGVLNQVGKAIRVCGEFINTDVNSTKQNIQVYLDAAGSDVAGSPVKIGDMEASAGPGTAATYKGHFCETFHTTVSGAGATAGSIFPDMSLLNYYLASAPILNMLGGEKGTAAVGSINLAGGGGFENRLSIVHTNTTGNSTTTLQNVTIEVL